MIRTKAHDRNGHHFSSDPDVQGSYLVDGLAYDSTDDSLVLRAGLESEHLPLLSGNGRKAYWEPFLNIVRPKDENGGSESDISGVVVGSAKTHCTSVATKGSGARIVRIHKIVR